MLIYIYVLLIVTRWHANTEIALLCIICMYSFWNLAIDILNYDYRWELLDKCVLETKVDWYENFRLKDLIDIIRTTDPNDFMVEFFIEVTDNVHRGSAIVINTSDELESDALNALSSMFPSLYPIGPLPSFLNQTP